MGGECLRRRGHTSEALLVSQMGWGQGLRRTRTHFQLCHFVFLTTLCPQKKELSQRPVLFCGRSLTGLPQGDEVS